MKLASVIIEDYPFHDAVFPYEIPAEFEAEIGFGTLLLVPFGPHNQPRLGLVIECVKTEEFIENIKPIYQVITQNAILKKQFRTLRAITVFYQIPLSKCLSLAGFFPKTARPKLFYLPMIASEESLIGFKNAKSIYRYLAKHKDGIDPILFRKRFHLTQKTTILKKLENRGIIQKKYMASLCQFPVYSDQSCESSLLAVNGMNQKERAYQYIQYIHQNKRKHVLVVTPSQTTRDELHEYFNQVGLSDRVHLSSKHELLQYKKPWDLVIVENSTSHEYQMELPFSFHQEKIALMKSKIDGHPLIFGSYLPSLFTFEMIQSGLCRHFNKRQIPSLWHPKIIIRSMNQEIAKHGFHLIPYSLQGEINRLYLEGKKTLLLLNRKGYVNILQCKNCSSLVVCKHCGAPMQLLSDRKTLRCRNCNEKSFFSPICPKCGLAEIRMASFGTEKLEEEAKRRYPNMKIVRIDKNQTPISSLDIHDSNLIIGTTLTLNKVDWESIDFCCLLGIDARMNYPVYHNQADIFFLFSHLSEKLNSVYEKRKNILVFSFTPKAELFQWLTPGKVKLFYEAELKTRKELRYPPYIHLMEWCLQSQDIEEIKKETESIISFFSSLPGRVDCLPTRMEKMHNGVYASHIQFRTKDLWNLYPFFCVKIDELKKNEKIVVDVKKWEW